MIEQIIAARPSFNVLAPIVVALESALTSIGPMLNYGSENTNTRERA
jgi:hypothetical protein